MMNQFMNSHFNGALTLEFASKTLASDLPLYFKNSKYSEGKFS